MPLSRTPTFKTRDEAPYAAFAEQFEAWIVAYSNKRRMRFVQRTAAEQMHINNTTFSKFVRGREVPTPENCLILARYLDVPVDEVLRAAGYLDLAGLREWVVNDTTLRKPREREYILNVLAIALGMEQWQQEAAKEWRAVSEENAYKDKAQRALASSGDPYIRAKDYADAVYDWGHSPNRNAPREERTTDDLPFLISGSNG